MNIKEILHYYMGQKVQVPGAVSWAILNSSNYAYFKDGCVLALRPLDSMTEEERADLFKRVFGRVFPSHGQTRWIEKETHNSCKRWCLSSGLDRLGIEMNGTVWADCDLHAYKFAPGPVFHYLLSRGFDLFGLIESGAAVDVKTIN